MSPITKDADPCSSVFSESVEVLALAAPGRARFRLHHVTRDRSCVVGESELFVARLFDGQRSLSEIRSAARQSGAAISEDALRLFEARLIEAGILDNPSARPTDPFTGMHYGPFHRFVVLRIVQGDPDRWLTAAARPLAVIGPALPLLGAVTALSAIVLTAAARTSLSVAWPSGLTAWLGLYLLVALGAVIHELGHAMACRLHGVSVREVGLASYFFVPTGWTRPDQRAWSALPMRVRIATLLAGPVVSLAVAAGGACLVLLSPGLASFGALLCVSGWIGALPTLLPLFNGDGYLALTELAGTPSLRRKSFTYAAQRLRGQRLPIRPSSRFETVLLLGVAGGTVLGWVAVWFGMLWLFGRMLWKA